MRGEIDGDFYCAANAYSKETGNCGFGGESYPCARTQCNYCRRKWPAPEQFLEEYGHEWPGDSAVYYLYKGRYRDNPRWILSVYGSVVRRWADAIVCACTPWGKPPDDWRPQ